MKEDLIKKYHLEEAQKRFQQICEYRFNAGPIEEDDNDNMNNQQPPQGQQPPMNGGMGEPVGGQQQSMGSGNPNAQMDADPNGGMGEPMGGDPGMGDDPNDGMGNNPMGGDTGVGADPNDEMGEPMGDDPGMGADSNMSMDDDTPMTDQMQPNDEVISVDDLTQSQETTEYKVDGVDDKLTALINVLPKFIEALNQNDAKLEDLKAEIEKRNPTSEEKMNIRSQASYPYSESPKGYWERKLAENPHYDVIYDNDVSPSDEQDEYILHKDDIKSDNDKALTDTFRYPQELKDILEF